MEISNDIIWKDWILLDDFINEKYSKIILLTDSNVKKLCLNTLTSNLMVHIDHVITVGAGEQNKNLVTAEYIWQELIKIKADKKAILICLGGGMITDLGGFCASVYKRGLPVIFIPTTLLAMTDAAIGGKTGLDLGPLKNMIGSFYSPRKIFIHPSFLNTLPDHEWLNGYAEIIKHAIIEDAHLWKMMGDQPDYDFKSIDDAVLQRSLEVKKRIVAADPFERSDRKKLNFGHTTGHALESFFLANGKELAHGFAVAAGIWIESYLNYTYGLLDKDDFTKIAFLLDGLYAKPDITAESVQEISHYCLHDKKNEFGKISITKILTIGHSEPELVLSLQEIETGLIAYIQNHTGRILY